MKLTATTFAVVAMAHATLAASLDDSTDGTTYDQDSTDIVYDDEPAYTTHYINAKDNLLQRNYNFDSSDKDADDSNDLNLLGRNRNCKDGFIILSANSWASTLYDGYHTYPNNLKKCWVLDAGPGNTVSFEVEATNMESTFDHLKAYNIVSFNKRSRSVYGQSSTLETYTGQNGGSPAIQSSGRYLYLEFNTDYSVQGGGFRAKYKEYQTNAARCFYNIGTGQCRDADGSKGRSQTVCRGRNRCTLDTCQQICRLTNGCVGVEYKAGTCKVQTEGVAAVRYKRNTTCYTYEYCDH